MLILPGVLQRRQVLVIIYAKFEVHAAQEPPRVELIADTIEVLYKGSTNVDRAQAALNDDAVDHFRALIAAIKLWVTGL